MELTIEEKRILTEFLGECWHEWHQCDDKEGRFCIKCDIEEEDCANYRFDFSDWRVVGRLVEKMREELNTQVNMHKEIPARLQLRIYDIQNALWRQDDKEAICRAILVWLKEGNNGR